jgi:hypothetical protein
MMYFCENARGVAGNVRQTSGLTVVAGACAVRAAQNSIVIAASRCIAYGQQVGRAGAAMPEGRKYFVPMAKPENPAEPAISPTRHAGKKEEAKARFARAAQLDLSTADKAELACELPYA